MALGASYGRGTAKGKQSGIVAHWNETKGMGYITPRKGAEDLYVHKTQLVGCLSLGAGVEVNYDFSSQRGRLVALNVSKAVEAPVDAVLVGKQAIALRIGIVSSWVEERGMGFITPVEGGPDFFVHRSGLLEGRTLVVGSQVSFEPNWDTRKGKPMALRVGATVPQGHAVGSILSAGCRAAPYDSAAASAATYPAISLSISGLQASSSSSAVACQISAGTVTTWVEERGMGFITPADGGHVHFVQRSNLLDCCSLVLGAAAAFESHWDEVKDKFYALNVRGAVPQIPETPITHTDALSDFQAGNMGITAGSTASLDSGSVASQVDVVAGSVVQIGIVSMWFEDRGVGYITPSSGGQAIFVQRKRIEEGLTLSTGLPVCYQAILDIGTNKLVAWNVCRTAPPQN